MSEEAPIRCLSRVLVAENRRFRLFFDHVSGQGEDVPAYLVVEPLDLTGPMVSGIAVLPVRDGGDVGLLRVWRHPAQCWSLEAARGFIDAGETPEQAAARELGEEAALAGTILALGGFLPDGGVLRARVHLFAMEHCVTDTSRVDDRELGLSGLIWMPLAQALALADAGAIEDGATLTALYRYSRRSG